MDANSGSSSARLKAVRQAHFGSVLNLFIDGF